MKLQLLVYTIIWASILPCCTECRRGLAMRILSICLSNAWIVTKGKNVQIFIPWKRSF